MLVLVFFPLRVRCMSSTESVCHIKPCQHTKNISRNSKQTPNPRNPDKNHLMQMPIQCRGSPRALGKLPLASSSLGLPVQKQCKTLNPSLRQPFQGAEASSQSWISSQCGSSEHLLSILWTQPSWSQSPLLHERIPKLFAILLCISSSAFLLSCRNSSSCVLGSKSWQWREGQFTEGGFQPRVQFPAVLLALSLCQLLSNDP